MAHWDGSAVAPVAFFWATPRQDHSWIGNTYLFGKVSSRTFNLSFSIMEYQAACTAFTLEYAVDDRIASARHNGHRLEVPAEQGAKTFSQLLAPRGQDLFIGGPNKLEVIVQSGGTLCTRQAI